MSKQENVRRWREEKGKELFKKRYHRLRQAGFNSYDATKHCFKSDEKIKKIIAEKEELECSK